MPKSVYIETTIPSYYFETRKAPILLAWREATRIWWDRYRYTYRLYTSRYVIAELKRTPEQKAGQMLRMLAGIEIIEEPADVAEVAA